jgi:2'-5' RNA ligase
VIWKKNRQPWGDYICLGKFGVIISDMPDSAQIRAFIAINLPAEVREKLERVQRELKSALADSDVRWTKPEQVHLTLKFLGDIAADSLEDLKRAIQRACEGIAPFLLRAESLGVFPDSQKPRVIWVDVHGETDFLRRLQERVEQETVAWRELEQRTFQPHLTLARVHKLKPQEAQILREKIRGQTAAQFGTWRAVQVDLMQSKLSSTGAEHFQLAEFPLGG